MMLNVSHSIPLLPARRVWLNLAAFQVAWFATVLGASNGLPWLGPMAVLVALGLYLVQTRQRAAALRLLLAAALVGLVVEHALFFAGFIRYPGDPAWVPLWMWALWPLFATTLRVSLAWFIPRPALAAFAGAVAGPMAYAGGEALGAIELEGFALPLLALVWAFAFPLLLYLARKVEQGGSA